MGMKVFNCIFAVIDYPLELGQQFRSAEFSVIFEFEGPISDIFGTANTGNDPLSQVAAKMVKNNSNTVDIRMCSIPDVFFIQLIETMNNSLVSYFNASVGFI